MLSLEVHDEDFGAVFVEVAVNDLVVTNSGSLVEEVKRHMDLEPVFERTDLDRSNDLDGGEFEEFKKYDLGYSHGRLLPSSCIAACENCYRSHITNDRSDPYYFDMYRTWTKNIVGVQTPLRLVKAAKSAGTSKVVDLCTECHSFLIKAKYVKRNDRFSWSNVWPSFYWNLLTGADMNTGRQFHSTYTPEQLWRFVPQTIREYWLVSIHLPLYTNSYRDCTLEYPASHFVDRTKDVRMFWENIKLYTFKGMLEVLDPDRLTIANDKIQKSFIVPDVLCPWGCSEFCFKTTELNPGLLLQHHLRKVQLNLPQQDHQKMYSVDSSRLDYIRRDNEDGDFVLMNPDWPISPSVRLSSLGGLVICACRHHDSIRTRKRMMPHPPRKPYSDPLSSVRTDRLCQASIQSFVKPAVAKRCNTVPSLNNFSITYQGAWSQNVCMDAGFGNYGEQRMSHRHESLSLHRPDIRQAATVFKQEGKVSQEMLDQWRAEYDTYPQDMLKSLTRGATYTPSINAIILQKNSTHESNVFIKDYDKCPSPDDLTNLKISCRPRFLALARW